MAVKFRDYYEVLGVPRDADADQIKRAYRALARKHHPDLQPADQRAKASEAFKEINEAYEVLGDPEKRRKYDALGAGWRSGQDFTPPPGAAPEHGAPPGFEEFGGFSDFFESLFGRGPGRARAGRFGHGEGFRFEMPGGDVEAEIGVTIDELIRGGRRRIALDGRPGLDVEIPPGARDGTVLRLAGQGEPGIGGGPPGDLFLRLRLAPHPRYRANGDDLEMDLPLWPWQAVLGAQVRVETPDGAVRLRVPPGTPAGRRLRLRGRGLPRSGSRRGDLYTVVTIRVPENPNAEERAAYEALQRSSGKAADRPAED